MDSTLLGAEADQAGMSEELLNKLILDAMSDQNSDPPPTIPQSVIKPKPGFCVKCKTDKMEKVFLNVCMADNIPEPKDITDEELIKLLESEDPSGFRIPMSLGEPHTEMDRSGGGCTVYDIVINKKLFDKIQNSEIFKRFFLTATVQSVEEKYKITIHGEYIILKNRKFVGNISEQNIRTTPKPFIMEMDESNQTDAPLMNRKSQLIQEIDTPAPKPSQDGKRGPEPAYIIIQEPAEGYPEFMVAEVHLPLVKSANTVSLDLGEDRILLQTRSNVYFLDIYLPYNMIQEESGSQFNRKTKILTITMPIVPCS